MSRDHEVSLRRGAWTLPWLLGFLILTAGPLALSLWYSLTDYSLLDDPVFIGLENYRELWGDSVFWISVRNTIVYTIAAVGAGTVLSVGLALLLARPGVGTSIVRAVVFFPTLVPIVAVALAWVWMFNSEQGLINRTLASAGGSGVDWLGDPDVALWSMVIMGLWSIGGAVVINVAALQETPFSQLEAAALDGAGAWRRTWHITLPSISPAIFFNVLMATIWSIQIFAAPLIMTEGGPDNATLFYSMYLYNNAFIYGRMGYACAMSTLQLAAVMAIALGMFAIARRVVYYRGADA